MNDPSEPMCGPAACLRAEAEDLRERAGERDEARAIATEAAITFGSEAEAMLALAERYERAAAQLDELEPNAVA